MAGKSVETETNLLPAGGLKRYGNWLSISPALDIIASCSAGQFISTAAFSRRGLNKATSSASVKFIFP